MDTVLVLGDQLNRNIGALAEVGPGEARVLMVESEAMIATRPFHRQRLHFILASMRRFSAELEKAGYEVDYRCAEDFAAGLAGHRKAHQPDRVIGTEPNSRAMRSRFEDLDVQMRASNQFLCSPTDFATWADGRDTLRLEDFYRWQRKRLDYLMEGAQPAGGRWNYDEDNREPPPDEAPWPSPPKSRLDYIDEEVLERLPSDLPGSAPAGWWATSRRAALARLNHFVDEVLPGFGPHEDAMMSENWHLAHSMLSPYLNVGLILAEEVCDRIQDAYDEGRVPINSAEGAIRQIIGWREFVWGIYWLWPEQLEANELGHRRALPPSFTSGAHTDMRCLQITLDALDERAWVHHIQRLMVLSNFANLYGADPVEVRHWMRERYIDGANWVMGPNVMGMGLWADGGRMSTKPYVSGGAYINRMSDYCGECRFDPRKRVGDDACPFTTLYWDFLARHRSLLEGNGRMGRQYHTLDRLDDIDQVRDRARELIESIGDGEL